MRHITFLSFALAVVIGFGSASPAARPKFEVPAHRWADIAEPDYGRSPLNDCKCGHDCHDVILRLTLLRSLSMPDPDCDRGEHTFTHALCPHMGDWRAGGTVRAAVETNLLEEERRPCMMAVGDGARAISLMFRPFEIKTIVLDWLSE